MKNLTLIFSFILFFSLSAFAQKENLTPVNNTIDTISFKVDGLCGMCKTRIENAAVVKGVKNAEWNKSTRMLQLIYDKAKTNLDEVHSSIAKAGHDTSLKKGDDKAYAKLPACCKYREANSTSH